MSESELRKLPSVERVLEAMGAREPAAEAGHRTTVEAIRGVLEGWRRRIGAGEGAPSLAAVVKAATTAAEATGRSTLRPVINATGVLLQTNLGRAPLSERAIRAAEEAAREYSNLEYDVESGSRGSRHEHVRQLLRRTTGAEDGIALNNNAAALLMALQVFAQGGEVIVSRGQAVEIGGGFRIPDVLRQSGARLVEVGTTNRTYAKDYEAAITGEAAAILRVHTSNFQVVGFVHQASAGELSEVARRHDVLLIDDLGSGCLVDTARFGLPHEPTVQESVAAGADLVLFSGDKLLGGPQAGIMAGQSELIEQLRQHTLSRALRLDKMAIAALNATLAAYAEGREAEEIPLWRMLSLPAAALRRRARKWAGAAGEAGSVVTSRTMVGGGSLPGAGVETPCAAIAPPGGAERLAAALRAADPPVLGRVSEERVLLDPRAVPPVWDGHVADAIRGALAPR
jgi:L-seryl-tRNA(Ser) seleniumtransferase